MFEQGLSFILKRILKDFVEDGDNLNEKVQVGVWSGLIVLENLVLKNSILSLVDVPLSLCYGYIGRLEIRIPWSRLGFDPVTITIDKINILLEPKYEWNPGAIDRREQAIKQAKLAAAEIFANQRFDNPSWSSSNRYTDFAKNWVVNALLGKLVDNFQVTLREVHIRYEDKLSCPSNFCIGMSFESLHLQSRDPPSNRHYSDDFAASQSPISKSIFFQDTGRNYDKELKMNAGEGSVSKLIEINHFTIYWNPLVQKGLNICCCTFVGRSPKEILSLMSRSIATRVCKLYDRPRHHYILQPTDIKSSIDFSINVTTGAAKVRHSKYLFIPLIIEIYRIGESTMYNLRTQYLSRRSPIT